MTKEVGDKINEIDLNKIVVYRDHDALVDTQEVTERRRGPSALVLAEEQYIYKVPLHHPRKKS